MVTGNRASGCSCALPPLFSADGGTAFASCSPDLSLVENPKLEVAGDSAVPEMPQPARKGRGRGCGKKGRDLVMDWRTGSS